MTILDSAMASSTDYPSPVDEEVRQLYERYQAADNAEDRHEILLEIGALDGRRHEEIYDALEDE
ncbi:hypothetical protein [Haloarchaeobius sp. DFWS5]|uniref:hypothetical protein n=1 Tax=Haloarchaeobius sp. DFWS5 TaxID=3446114 RepID=UPI003EBD6A9C